MFRRVQTRSGKVAKRRPAPPAPQSNGRGKNTMVDLRGDIL